jgi:butyryl-CoA dehydrogenase
LINPEHALLLWRGHSSSSYGCCHPIAKEGPIWQPISSLQAIQFMLLIWLKTSSSQLLYLEASSNQDNGIPFTAIASLAKCFAGDTAMKVTTDAVQVFGGYGYIKDYPVEKYFRDAKIMQIFEGTAQVQRLVIAKDLLSD